MERAWLESHGLKGVVRVAIRYCHKGAEAWMYVGLSFSDVKRIWPLMVFDVMAMTDRCYGRSSKIF